MCSVYGGVRVCGCAAVICTLYSSKTTMPTCFVCPINEYLIDGLLLVMPELVLCHRWINWWRHVPHYVIYFCHPNHFANISPFAQCMNWIGKLLRPSPVARRPDTHITFDLTRERERERSVRTPSNSWTCVTFALFTFAISSTINKQF